MKKNMENPPQNDGDSSHHTPHIIPHHPPKRKKKADSRDTGPGINHRLVHRSQSESEHVANERGERCDGRSIPQCDRITLINLGTSDIVLGGSRALSSSTRALCGPGSIQRRPGGRSPWHGKYWVFEMAVDGMVWYGMVCRCEVRYFFTCIGVPRVFI